MSEVPCGTKHDRSDAPCIRPLGHEGRCWGKWSPHIQLHQRGHIYRPEWIDGVHLGYASKYAGQEVSEVDWSRSES